RTRAAMCRARPLGGGPRPRGSRGEVGLHAGRRAAGGRPRGVAHRSRRRRAGGAADLRSSPDPRTAPPGPGAGPGRACGRGRRAPDRLSDRGNLRWGRARWDRGDGSLQNGRMATLLRGGTVFDGDGGPGRRADVLVVDDRVERIGEVREVPPDTVEIDATGCWVTPGFVDIHTHYDAELEFAPSLSESLRHGVTTVLVGSCGLSFAVGEPEDLADMFCRVEGVPRDGVLPLLERVVDWDSPAGYLDHLSTLPLGPNVVSLLGHSAIRARAMGFGRSVDERERPTPAELDLMVRMVDEALDAGYLGLSVNTLPWDKLDGSRYRSRPTPSVFARWSEYRALVGPVRDRGAVFQAVPNIQTRWNLAPFAALASKVGHPPLRTMLISMAYTVS